MGRRLSPKRHLRQRVRKSRRARLGRQRSASGELLKDATARYKAGDYDAAIERFEAAYALKPNPTLVYNIARCYERAAKLEQAIAAYERFLELPGTTSKLRAGALSSIDALKRERALRNRKETPKIEEGAPPPTVEAPKPTVRQVTPAPRPRSRVLEWTLLGVGLAALGGGLTLGLFASAGEKDYTRATSVEEQERIESRTRARALGADLLYGVGGTSVVVSLILWLFLDDASSAPVTIAPDIVGDGGLTLHGQF